MATKVVRVQEVEDEDEAFLSVRKSEEGGLLRTDKQQISQEEGKTYKHLEQNAYGTIHCRLGRVLQFTGIFF